ncbi:hypothetical protein [Rhodococcus sp. SJ-2]
MPAAIHHSVRMMARVTITSAIGVFVGVAGARIARTASADGSVCGG